MERHKRVIVFIFILASVGLHVKAYNADEINAYLDRIPASERPAFLRYALNRGYELVESPPIQAFIRTSPKLLQDMYEYFTHNFLVPPNQLSARRDVICFPSGCIEIDDPGIHP